MKSTKNTKVMKMSKIVAIYAGHGVSQDGSWDSGCTYKGYQEAKLVMPIVRSAVYYLKQCGVKCLTDYHENRINMVKQVAEANKGGAAVFVSVHLDYSAAPSGTMPLYISEEGRKLAASMNKSVKYYSSLGTRGLSKRVDLYELKATDMPACIFEAGGIKADLTTIKHEYDFIGFGIAKGICRYLGIPFTPIQYKILQKARVMEKKVVGKMRYNGKSTYNTYGASLKGNKTINCALYVSWILQRAGILNTHSRIWFGNEAHGSGVGALKRSGTISHPNRWPKHTDLHVGDVVGYQWGSSKANKVHTMIVLRYNNGRPVFATCGGSDLKAKDLSRKRLMYERKKIKTLWRAK